MATKAVVDFQIIRCGSVRKNFGGIEVETKDPDAVLGDALAQQVDLGWEPKSLTKDGAEWVVLFTRPIKVRQNAPSRPLRKKKEMKRAKLATEWVCYFCGTEVTQEDTHKLECPNCKQGGRNGWAVQARAR